MVLNLFVSPPPFPPAWPCIQSVPWWRRVRWGRILTCASGTPSPSRPCLCCGMDTLMASPASPLALTDRCHSHKHIHTCTHICTLWKAHMFTFTHTPTHMHIPVSMHGPSWWCKTQLRNFVKTIRFSGFQHFCYNTEWLQCHQQTFGENFPKLLVKICQEFSQVYLSKTWSLNNFS